MNLSRNLSWRYTRMAESFFLIAKVEYVVAWYVFLSYYKNLLDLSDRSVFCFYGFHDCNSVHYTCGLMSIVLRLCLHYSRLIMISYADATLVGELLSIFCLHGLRDHFWWELLDSFHDNGHPDHVQLIDVTWVDAVDPSSWCRCCRLVTTLVYYTATGLWFELISVSCHCVDACDAKSERLPSRAK